MYDSYVTMTRGVVYETSFLILICVLSLFFFPAAKGPYSAVHGPATTLQAARFSVRLRNAIAAVLSSASPAIILDRAGYFSSVALLGITFAAGNWISTETILRC
jgi:hypothetical protein